ncbi:hypothetical protein HQQ82_04070 [Rathayibacter sp. VKM Ac-2856]|uniref:hypothetical protein n=1 Tax=Rathayibacter sp. VKM Ac-2856 TaxID=2739021 RepID=UPI001566C450|nr:hypothetical protein [Rathayibacter sp. VKM Ac-2856]NQX19141.1 hypothetical protein [Rathayibacter sp. VKM Ac-2856]
MLVAVTPPEADQPDTNLRESRATSVSAAPLESDPLKVRLRNTMFLVAAVPLLMTNAAPMVVLSRPEMTVAPMPAPSMVRSLWPTSEYALLNT